MLVINNDKIVCCDVDDTLVLHNPVIDDRIKYSSESVDIVDPLNKTKTISMMIHGPMVRLLKEELHRGTTVIVWSRGGFEWAQAVLTALKIESDNIIVMSKPHTYFDDKDVSEWLKHRTYLEPNKFYKGVK